MTRFNFILIIILCGCFAAGPAFARTITERDYQFAEGLRQRGLYTQAAKAYQEFLTKYPDTKLAEYVYYYMGLSYKKAGNTDAALESWQLLQEKFKDSQAVKKMSFQLAELYVDRGTDLIDRYEEENDAGLRAKALEYFEKAADSYDAFIKKDDDSATGKTVLALFNIAYCYERLEAFSKAIYVYEKLARDYSDFEAQFKVGDVYLNWAKTTLNPETRKRNLVKALEGFRKTLLFGDTEFYDDAKLSTADVLVKMGKHKEAREMLIADVNSRKFEKIYITFAKSRQVDAMYLEYLAPRGFFTIAECYEKEGDLDNAVTTLKLLIKRFPKSEIKGRAQKKMSDVLEKRGVVAETQDIEGALRILDIAKNYNNTSEYSKAIVELDKIRLGFKDLRKSNFYNEYLLALTEACYFEKHLLNSGITGEYLARRVKPSDNPYTRDEKVSMKGEALYYAGNAYWEYAEALNNEKAKNVFQLLAIKQLEHLAHDVPTHKHAANSQLHAAGYYLQAENYERAAINYAGFLEKLTDRNSEAYTEAMFNLAYCFLKAENWTKAEKEYSKFISLYDKKNEKVVQALDLLGGVFIRQEKYDAAAKTFKRLDPESFVWIGGDKLNGDFKGIFEDSHYQTGYCYYKLNNFKKAIEKYAYFTENFPDNPKVPSTRLLLAQLYFDRDDHKNVVKILGDFISKYKDGPEAYKGYILLIESYLKTTDIDKAMEIELEMFREYGRDELTEGAYGKIAKIMRDSGQIEGAKIAYQELITDYRDDPDVLERGLWFSAEFAFETLEELEKKGKSLTAKNERADNARKQKEYLKLASDRYTQYLSVATENLRRETNNPNAVPARWFELQFRLGEIFEKLKEYKRAEKIYNRVAARALRNNLVVEAQYRIGHMWLKTRDYKKALGSFIRIASFNDPNDKEIRKWVGLSIFEAGVAFKRLNKKDKAEEYLRRFLDEFKEPEYNVYCTRAVKLLKELSSD